MLTKVSLPSDCSHMSSVLVIYLFLTCAPLPLVVHTDGTPSVASFTRTRN